MTDISLSILFFFTILCFLTYSCTWFSRTLRNYQFEMARHAPAQSRTANSDCHRISVYTIERGSQRQTVINYDANTSPPTYKEDLPPAYSEAIRMSMINSLTTQQPTTSTSTAQNTLPRRSSCTI